MLPNDPHDDAPNEYAEPAILEAAVAPETKQVGGHTRLAWCVILAVSALMVVGPRFRPQGEEGAADNADSQESSAIDQVFTKVAEVQAKIIVAFSELTRADRSGQGQASRQQMRRQIEAMNQGPPSARLRFVVLAGELGDPDDALSELERLRLALAKSDRTFSAEEEKTANLLDKIYSNYDLDPQQPLDLPETDVELLRNRLGWFADLALAPYGGPNPEVRQALVRSAQKTLIGAFLVGLMMAALGCLGFVILVTLMILAATGRLTSKLEFSEVHPGIYAETFAWWMVLYIGSMLGIGALTARLDWEVGRWTAPLAAQALSLAALLWPVVRGVRFSDVRRDVGISLPSYAWLEPFRGIAAYALSLPILMVGVMCTIMLIQLQALFTGAGDPFTTPNVPAHPIIESVDDHNPWIFWQILLLAAVGAPIVEEIMFRGVLYRSLRDSTRGLRAAGSVAASMAISGFLFAVIHPQGWVAIPALGALATGFAIAREWRGTIWPSVIAHGINNGLVTVLLFSMFGGS